MARGGTNRTRTVATRRQGIFWILTIPQHCFTPYCPSQCSWIRGQLELAESGFLHWQIIVAFRKKVSLSGCRDVFGSYHAELSRSDAASEYCWKHQTAVTGTQFEIGAKPIKRNDPTDWEKIWTAAQSGVLDSIPANVRVVSYRTLRAIASDYVKPVAIVRRCNVYWGPTGTGKSYRAWSEAGSDAYPKDPRTKFWCGYQGESNVIIDEFRGGIDIAHLLRWLDRYPVRVEVKGSSVCLLAETYWITSNLSPGLWYPDADPMTVDALMRRINIINLT